MGSITPTDAKLVSKGVKSVRQHIALLKDYTDISLEDFKAFVRRDLCEKTHRLTDEDVRIVEEIEREYLTPEFIYGSNPRYSVFIIGESRTLATLKCASNSRMASSKP